MSTIAPERQKANPMLKNTCPLCGMAFFNHHPLCGLKSPYPPPVPLPAKVTYEHMLMEEWRP